MNQKASFLRTLARSRRGANMVEYLILVGLVALIGIGGYKAFGESVTKKTKTQGTTVDAVNDKGP